MNFKKDLKNFFETKILLPRAPFVAAKAETWDEFHAQQKEKYPIRYFIYYTMAIKIRRIHNTIRYKWYDIRCAVWDRYNVIKVDTLPPTWQDTDEKLLHVCFQLLVDYVEKEKCFDRIDWDYDEDHKKIGDEIRELYHWWKEVYPHLEETLPPFPKTPEDRLSILNNPKTDEAKAFIKVAEQREKMREQFYEQENEMLGRLIKIRNCLWT